MSFQPVGSARRSYRSIAEALLRDVYFETETQMTW